MTKNRVLFCALILAAAAAMALAADVTGTWIATFDT